MRTSKSKSDKATQRVKYAAQVCRESLCGDKHTHTYIHTHSNTCNIFIVEDYLAYLHLPPLLLIISGNNIVCAKLRSYLGAL